jgi:hypothetical protein
MMWMYSVPTWALGVLVVGLTVVIATGGFVLLHRLYPGERSGEAGGLAVSFIGVVSTFHSLLLAFSAVLVWQDFQDSEKAVAIEASSTADVYRDLEVYGGTIARTAQDLLAQYVTMVVEEEWSAMDEGNGLEKVREKLDEVFRTAASLNPQTPREQVIYAEIFRHINELLDNREERLRDAQSTMPGLFWAIVLIATALLIAYTGILPLSRINTVMVAGVAAAIGLIFFFIVAMDHPFAGETGVDPAPFVDLLHNMQAAAKAR